jgi:hypothetical protein
MKNIFLLPTDKPSSLVLETKNNNLFITTTKDFGTKIMKFQHIYITNTEEIKEGDWCLIDHNVGQLTGYSILKCLKADVQNGEYLFQDKDGDKFTTGRCDKIILTTDQDLIADGIQEISEDFLQWFVQNSDCEYVEVVKYHGINTSIAEISAVSGNDDYNWKGRGDFRDYKIIIPQEEPKQYTSKELEGFEDFKSLIRQKQEEPKQEFPQLGTKEFNNLASTHFGGKPQEEPKQYPIGGYAPGNYTCTCITCKERFFGDKRAVQCEPCAIEMVNAEIDINKEGGVEENKQELNFYEKLKEYFNTTPREKVLEDWNKSADFDKVGPTLYEFIENSNEERLKETAKRLYEYQSQNPPYTIITPKDKIEGFIEGATSDVARDYWYEKFQQEQDNKMYSEVEVLAMLENYDSEFKLDTFAYTYPCTFTVKEWFSQFKNK